MEKSANNTGEVKFESRESSDYSDNGSSYFLCVTGDKMHCSCGRELVKLDDGNYKCKGGYPIYRPEQGEVKKDKNGELWLKFIPHEEEQ